MKVPAPSFDEATSLAPGSHEAPAPPINAHTPGELVKPPLRRTSARLQAQADAIAGDLPGEEAGQLRAAELVVSMKGQALRSSLACLSLAIASIRWAARTMPTAKTALLRGSSRIPARQSRISCPRLLLDRSARQVARYRARFPPQDVQGPRSAPL